MSDRTKDTDTISQSELDRLIRYNAELIRSKNNLANLIPSLREAAAAPKATAAATKRWSRYSARLRKTSKP